MAGNRPELAAADADTKWYEGAGLVESVVGSYESFVKMEWGGGVGNLTATGLGVLGAVMDPLQAVFAAGVSWLMEHVEFLRKPLDDLCGNPKEIEAHALTWQKIRDTVYDSEQEYVADVKASTAEWTARSADAYRHRAARYATDVAALGGACDALASRSVTAGALIGIVRNTIRDIVADLIGAAISKALQAVFVVTIPKVIAEVAILVAKCTAKITKLLSKLSKTIGALRDELSKLRWLMETLASKLREAGHGATMVAASRIEAAGSRLESPIDGLADFGKAYGQAFRTISQGHKAIHGALFTGAKDVAIDSARSNGAQNNGGTVDKLEDRKPPVIDLPL